MIFQAPNRKTEEVDEILLTTSQSASLLQVHESSIKRWCNQGALEVHKTEGGHRRIPLEVLADFAKSRNLTFPFQSFEESLLLCRALLMYWREKSLDGFFDLGMTWISERKHPRLAEMVLELYQMFQPSLAMIGEHLICRWMYEVGRFWQDGRLSVVREHRLSQEMLSLLHGLREVMLSRRTLEPSSGKQGLGIVGTAEGSYHEIGAFCVRLLLEQQGWNVIYLGANVPTDELALLQQEENASLVCLSLIPPLRRSDMMRSLRTLGHFYDPSRPYVLVAGGGSLLEGTDDENVVMLTREFSVPGRKDKLRYYTFSSLLEFEEWMQEVLPHIEIAQIAQG